MTQIHRKKLIEIDLPLEAIKNASAREGRLAIERLAGRLAHGHGPQLASRARRARRADARTEPLPLSAGSVVVGTS